MATGEGKSSEDTTLAALESASKLTVTDENGQIIEFGSLFKNDKVIAIFVRVSLHPGVYIDDWIIDNIRLDRVAFTIIGGCKRPYNLQSISATQRKLGMCD